MNHESTQMTPEEVETMRRDDCSCALIDVREPDEFRSIHIPGAVNIPLSVIEKGHVSLPEAKRIVVYCKSGMRASKACSALSSKTTAELILLQGGVVNWKSCSLPVNEDKSAPISIERQVQIVAGTLVAAGTIFGVVINPWFLAVPILVGSGLMFAGITNTCGLAILLKRLSRQ